MLKMKGTENLHFYRNSLSGGPLQRRPCQSSVPSRKCTVVALLIKFLLLIARPVMNNGSSCFMKVLFCGKKKLAVVLCICSPRPRSGETWPMVSISFSSHFAAIWLLKASTVSDGSFFLHTHNCCIFWGWKES